MSRFKILVGPTVNTPFRKFMYNLSGFRKYGLFFNDCYSEYCVPELNEAIRRLPADVADARMKRLTIAFHHSANHTYLPEKEWTKYEEDVKYLDPYIEEVKREWAEKKEYEWNNYAPK